MIHDIDLSKYNKICVIGGPGVGKTYFTARLARELGRPIISLDEIRFAARRHHGASLTPDQCAKQLGTEMGKHKKYIVEGTAYQPWTEPAIANADIVVVLYQPAIVRCGRIFRRWVVDNKYHRSFWDTVRLMRISRVWYRKRYPLIQERIVSNGRAFVMIQPRRNK